VKNCNVAVDESKDHITFLYRIVPGGTDRSYGIYAAQLAGVPPEAVQRAKEILFDLEVGNPVSVHSRPVNAAPSTGAVQLSLFDSMSHPVVERLRSLDVNQLTPLQALALLDELSRDAK
jgi:DNA mismatch repair protein MutS